MFQQRPNRAEIGLDGRDFAAHASHWQYKCHKTTKTLRLQREIRLRLAEQEKKSTNARQTAPWYRCTSPDLV